MIGTLVFSSVEQVDSDRASLVAGSAPPNPENEGMIATPAPAPHSLTFRSGAVTKLLLIVVGSLLLMHLLMQYDRFHAGRAPWELQQLFDLDEEQSAPNWYSAAALGFASLLAAAICGRARSLARPDAARWAAVAWILLYLCFDEVAGVHETVNSLSPVSWTVPFGLLALGVGAWMLPFARRLPPPTRNGLILSGVTYVMGAVGIELLTSQFFDESNKRQFSYAFYTIAEEGMEMLGVVWVIRTLLRHMERDSGSATIEIKG